VDAQQKARAAIQLLGNEALGEIVEEAHLELTEYMIHGPTPEQREDARCRILGIREVFDRLQYHAGNLDEEPEEEADTLDTLEV
jgi:hypothetical protein